jgi:acylphosphatase
VQGVAYRYYAQKTAAELGLVGWVRNLPDGRVEALAQGNTDELDRFVSWCHVGSPSARVEQVRTTEEPLESNLFNFHIRH